MNCKIAHNYCSAVLKIAVRILISSFAESISILLFELLANCESMRRLSQ